MERYREDDTHRSRSCAKVRVKYKLRNPKPIASPLLSSRPAYLQVRRNLRKWNNTCRGSWSLVLATPGPKFAATFIPGPAWSLVPAAPGPWSPAWSVSLVPGPGPWSWSLVPCMVRVPGPWSWSLVLVTGPGPWSLHEVTRKSSSPAVGQPYSV